MLPVIVRAVRAPEREGYHAYLRDRLPGATWVFDERRDAMDTFLRALAAAGVGGALHVEDDVVLADRFAERVGLEVAARPGTVVQFFSMRGADLTIGSRFDRNFMMGQCFWLPCGYSREIAAYSSGWPRRAEHPTGLDVMVGDWLKSRREPYWIVVPNLVDHRVGPSTIDRRRSSRRVSKTFAG